MKTSKKGIDLIKFYEGFRAEAYKCPAGVWTIGYGHTGKDVHQGDKVSPEYASYLLATDLAEFEKKVTELVKVPLKQNQFDALVSFAYNCGAANLASSTLLKVINTNPDVYDAIAAQFKRWNKAGGKELAGLTSRREAEAKMYCI